MNISINTKYTKALQHYKVVQCLSTANQEKDSTYLKKEIRCMKGNFAIKNVLTEDIIQDSNVLGNTIFVAYADSFIKSMLMRKGRRKLNFTSIEIWEEKHILQLNGVRKERKAFLHIRFGYKGNLQN